MEFKLCLSNPFCAHKHKLIEELAVLSEQHFKLTSTLLDGGSLGKVVEECTRVRARWVKAERFLNQHVRVHHC
jgi:hypothetical protein